ncbi:MAG: hypothetical protein ACRDHS_14610, partial [Actinomycetota bacterium]
RYSPHGLGLLPGDCEVASRMAQAATHLQEDRDVTLSLDGAQLPGVILILLLFGLPLVGYVALVRRAVGSVLTGLAFVVLTIGVQMYVTARWEAGSSTAPLGYLSLLIYGLIVLVASVLLETILVYVTSRTAVDRGETEDSSNSSVQP